MSDKIYGGEIFFNDVTAVVSYKYLSYLIFLAILVIGSYFAISIINKIYNQNFFLIIKDRFYFTIDFNKRNIIINSIIIFFVSLLFKLLLFDFDIKFDGGTQILDNYYYGNKFDVYKLYTLIVVFFYKITNDYSLYLSIFNIIISCLTICTFYLLLSIFSKSFFFNNLVTLFVLIYLPFSAVDTLIRIDVLYLFLFTLSIFLTIKLTEDNNYKYVIALCIILFLSCIAREQTIYMLPLYLAFILFSRVNNKKMVASFVSLIVITTSLYLSYFNINKYGINSLFKDRILIIAAMQYGYLQTSIKKSYESRLSDNAKVLLNDINNSYIKNVLPSKREIFIDKFGLPGVWNLVRPDTHNIYDKNIKKNSPTNEQLISIKNNIIADLENLKDSEISMSSSDFNILMNKKQQQEIEVSDKRLLADIQSIVINDFYFDSTDLGSLKASIPDCIKSNNEEYNSNCLISVINNINRSYISARHDNWTYAKAALEIASRYDPETKKYIHHKYLNHINEIILSVPLLYITQSLLTGFSMTGYVPVPSGMTSRFIDIYSDSIFPDFFLYDFQELYYPAINFWYIHCFLLFIFTLFFMRNSREKNITLFLSFIPIYYGAFLSFANYAEFARLMMPVIPIILYNYFRLYKLVPIPMTLMFILPLTLLD